MDQTDFGRQQVRHLIAQTGLPVVTVSTAGQVEYVSPGLERLLGRSILGLADTDLGDALDICNEDGSVPLKPQDYPLVRARHGENVADALVTVRTADGRLVYLRVNAAPLRAPDGTVIAAVALLEDVTTEQSIRREQDELRTRLIETINHEFRTPLTKLFGHAELLQDLGEDLPPPLRRSVDAMLQASGDLRDFLQVLSELVDLERHARLNPTYGDLAERLRDLVESRAGQAAAKDVRLVADLPDELQVSVDHKETARAVRELLANALHYAPPGSEVVVRLAGADPLVEIEVSDEGPGIPEADRQRLLEPFERGAQPNQPVNSRGLGLAIAHTVATAHGGRLTLSSREPCGLRASLAIPRGRSDEDGTA